MKKRIVSIMLSCILTAGMLVGCGSSGTVASADQRDYTNLDNNSKATLEQMYVEANSNYNNISNQYQQLLQKDKALASDGTTDPGLSLVGTGTNGELTFNSQDAKIIFPTTFQYPNSTEASPNGSISIVDNVSVIPGANWTTKLNGTSLEMSHSSGISGTIKVSTITTVQTSDVIKNEVVMPWFQNIPAETLTTNDIFLSNASSGVQVKTPTMIDSENAQLTCGMLANGTNAVVYVFVYRGDKDSNKEENIANVVNSIKVFGNNVSVAN